MASIIFVGLALVGAYLNNNKINDENEELEDSHTNPAEDIQRRNIYDTRRLKKLYRDIDKKAKVMWDKSKNTEETNIVPKYYNSFIEPGKDDTDKLIKEIEKQKKIEKYEGTSKDDLDDLDNNDNIFGDHTLLFENSNKLINDSHYNKYLNKKNQSYADQFEDPKFDNKDPANAENSLHLDVERELKGGFSVINSDPSNDDLTYGMVENKDFTHNNMVPFFSGKSYGDFNDSWDHVKQNKVDLFSGSSREYVKKKEHAPLFNPTKDLTHTYGMPSTTEYRHSRYYSSLGRERKNETLFQPQRVAPGVNQGYNAYGVDGFHPSYRSLPKTIDELRPANRPQVTYSTPVKPGFKRHNRAVQAPVNKYRPETYREELKRNMVKNLGYIRAPKVRDNYFIKETNKETTLREHYGVAGNSETSIGKNVPIEMIPKVKKTDRQVYRHPGISNLSNSNRWDEKYLNWVQKSYFFPNNERSTTQFNQHLLVPKSGQGTVAYSPDDYRAKNTVKELTEKNQHTIGPNRGQGTIAYDPKDFRAKATIKEITENSKHLFGPNRGQGSIVYDPKVIAKNTIRETTENNQHITNMKSNQGTIAFNPLDYKAKNTMKEVTEHGQHITNAQSNQGTIAFNPLDYRAKNTMKEVTEHGQYILGPTMKNKASVAYDPEYRAKITIKETTENNQYVLGANRIGKGTVAFNPLDYKAKNTMKEVTEHGQYILGPTMKNKASVAYDPEDRAKITIKETTENNQYVLGANRVGKGTVAYNPIDYKAKNTIREITEHQQNILGICKGNRGAIAYDPTDYKAKNTIKQTTENNQHILGVNRGNRGNITYDPNSIAKTTVKETTENNQHILGANRGNRGNIAYDPNSIAKNTIRELTENNQHILGAKREGKGSIAYNPVEYRAKNTIRETTEHQQNILGANASRGGRAYDPEDRPNTTIRELTEHQQHILGASSGNKATVAYDPVSWEARGTNRQTTQNTYYVPAGHAYDTEAHRVYDAEYNAQIDDCKEVVAMSGRAPTQSNYPKGPISYLTNYKLKNKENINITDTVPDCRAFNSLYRMPVNITKSRMIIPQEEIRLDEGVLAGLDTNPFSIPSYFNDCEQNLIK